MAACVLLVTFTARKIAVMSVLTVRSAGRLVSAKLFRRRAFWFLPMPLVCPLLAAYQRDDKAQIVRDLDRMDTIFPRLQERTRQLAGSMSGGEQQMHAIARALMAAPRLIMVDEMSLGLAPVVAQQLMGVLGTIRAYVLETGRVVLAGSASQLIDDPAMQLAYLGLEPPRPETELS